jgi:hypothetical protein
MSPNALLSTEVYKLSRGILSPVIRLQDFDLLSRLVLHKSSKLLEPCEDLTLGLQEIGPKCEIVLDLRVMGPHASVCTKSNIPADLVSLLGNDALANLPSAHPLQTS